MADENNTKPRMTRRKEDSPFRRKEDELRFNVIDNLVSMIKYLILVIAIILYFFYSVIKDQNNTDAYQIKLLNDITEKVNANNELLSRFYSKNPIGDSVVPGTCTACHVPGRMDIKIPKEWALQNFKDYVRGDIRIPNNGIMPKFDSKMILDDQLEKIFIYLKTKDDKQK